VGKVGTPSRSQLFKNTLWQSKSVYSGGKDLFFQKRRRMCDKFRGDLLSCAEYVMPRSRIRPLPCGERGAQRG
jgi:hypothetical protein